MGLPSSENFNGAPPNGGFYGNATAPQPNNGVAPGDPGTGGTVQPWGRPGTQSQGGLPGMLGFTSQKATGPNGEAYDQERRAAQGRADAYGGLSTDYTQAAPTIANQFQGQSRSDISNNIGDQRNLANILVNNNGEASKAQFQSGLDQSIDAQAALANSTRGGAVAAAGAQRAAALQGGQQRAAGAATAAQLGAQEREASLGQAAGVYGNVGGQLQSQYGLEQGSAGLQAQLQGQSQGQQNNMRLGYGQLGNQAAGQSEGALNDYTKGNLDTQKQTADNKNSDTGHTESAIGTIAGALGGLFAKGGEFGSGHPILVGEHGPELILPDHPGYVMTAQQTAALRGAPPTDQQTPTLAAMFGVKPTAPAPHQATLSEALAGLAHLKARCMGGSYG